jgi:hypothetical protein
MGGGGAHGRVLESLGMTSESDSDNPPWLEDCSDGDSDGDRRNGDRSDVDCSHSHSDSVIGDGDTSDSAEEPVAWDTDSAGDGDTTDSMKSPLGQVLAPDMRASSRALDLVLGPPLRADLAAARLSKVLDDAVGPVQSVHNAAASLNRALDEALGPLQPASGDVSTYRFEPGAELQFLPAIAVEVLCSEEARLHAVAAFRSAPQVNVRQIDEAVECQFLAFSRSCPRS